MAYSVLIVDDDKRIRSGLTKHINWNELGFSPPQQAANAQEALAVFSRCKVDVLITDIRMPGVSGLDLCKKVSACYPKTVILILTGFSDFEYAKQAIQYGVKEYLTKPTDLVQLQNVLKRVHEKLEADRKHIEQKKDMENRYNQTVQLLLTQFWTDLSYGAIKNKATLTKFLQENSISFPFSLFSIMAVHISCPASGGCYDSHQLLHLLKSTIKMTLNDFQMIYYTYEIDSQDVNIILNFDDLSVLHAAAEQLRTSCHMLMRLDITLAVSSTTTELDGISNCYNQVRELLAGAGNTAGIFFFESSGTLSGEELSYAIDDEFLKEAEKQLLSYIASGEVQKSVNLVRHLFSRFPSTRSGLDFARDLFIKLLFALEQYLCNFNLGMKDILGKQFFPLHQAQQLGCVQDLEQWIENFVVRIIQYLESSKTSYTFKFVEQVKTYIETHYMEDITLFSAAEAVHLSPSYVSKIFKKNTNLNFVEYLTAVRINKAKELLCDINIKIYEVGSLVGYKSIKHFSQVFKSQTGMTPTEYRENLPHIKR